MNNIYAKIIADSVSPEGKRITTFEVSLPTYILAELNKHHAIVNSFASSRAIPCKKVREKVWKNPYMPVQFGVNQRGMRAYSDLEGWKEKTAQALWRGLSKVACGTHWLMEKIGLHKQVANRILEPWYCKVGVLTATEWDNFFKLRISEFAQPDFRKLATMMKEAMNNSTPKQLIEGDVHMPYVTNAELEKLGVENSIKVSVARCCRASYNNMLGKVSEPQEDVALFERALRDCHFSPFEHQAIVPTSKVTIAEKYNLQRGFRGWYQFRAMVDGEKPYTYWLKKFKVLK